MECGAFDISLSLSSISRSLNSISSKHEESNCKPLVKTFEDGPKRHDCSNAELNGNKESKNTLLKSYFNNNVNNENRKRKSISNEITLTKFQIWRNQFLVCLSYMFLFIAMYSCMFLQSTLNKASGIGTTSLLLACVGMLISAMFLPSLVIHKFSAKWAMTLSIIAYIPNLAANLYPSWAMMLTTGLIKGLSSGTIWATQSTYTSYLATMYAKQTGSRVSDVLSLFLGIFYLFVNSSKCHSRCLK